MKSVALISIAALAAASATAKPVTYVLDPMHTYPSFSADHMGGLSVWRGKFTKTSGKVVLDRAAKTGHIDVTVDVGSIDFGLAKLDEHARSPEIFDVAKYPTATYVGELTKWKGDVPTEARGTFTLHGVSRPLTLHIDSFECKYIAMFKHEVCGADAKATFNRADYGVSFGKAYGFNMQVRLQIQVEGSPASN
ncbi:MAG: polyisoprenoid-binding protein [Gammaproteobacteria bacterium]|nr:polyisoprenoid-binding protein [Gammaproteobacteria bacterium]